MKKLMIWVPLALFLFFVGVAAYQLTQPKDENVRSAMIGKPVPAFELADPDGQMATNAIFRDGQPKLLNVWASWCAPCIAEAPLLEVLKERGADIVGVALKDKPENMAIFLERYGNPYSRIVRDDYSQLHVAIGAGGVPETFVVDGEGIIRYQHIGPVMERDVETLLAELEKAK
ncbi:DsbE family thiol:disulfide interchange protein [Erythrobacter sp. SDW2]|uniref:DsbE family thiol:disulfide interchange protein n=1 Tax=Erythrobacter sp. SDW2 TaxID=2907154 RepID=UPI001F366D9C|nr:DsbE family thiol:disulfide interchange protein [Erythrobacter sp. SDW2]UIP06103.1 DsbE family thiol:disulfide interchange protein [Erythrobacter sp. SDW2]